MPYPVKTSFIVFAAVLLQSCSYSIIVSNRNGSFEASPVHNMVGYYNGKQVNTIDTVITLSVAQNNVMMVPSCPSGGFHSVEYKITFGDMLRNTFTLGKKKAVKVKYVCLKNEN